MFHVWTIVKYIHYNMKEEWTILLQHFIIVVNVYLNIYYIHIYFYNLNLETVNALWTKMKIVLTNKD